MWRSLIKTTKLALVSATSTVQIQYFVCLDFYSFPRERTGEELAADFLMWYCYQFVKVVVVIHLYAQKKDSDALIESDRVRDKEAE